MKRVQKKHAFFTSCVGRASPVRRDLEPSLSCQSPVQLAHRNDYSIHCQHPTSLVINYIDDCIFRLRLDVLLSFMFIYSNVLRVLERFPPKHHLIMYKIILWFWWNSKWTYSGDEDASGTLAARLIWTLHWDEARMNNTVRIGFMECCKCYLDPFAKYTFSFCERYDSNLINLIWYTRTENPHKSYKFNITERIVLYRKTYYY